MKHFLFIFAIIVAALSNTYALEASFTHAPDKDTGSTDGPLPLSQNQRNQLLQLDQQITQSPNPNETLQKVAEANGMEASELGDMLMRNRRDMEMAGGGGGGGGVRTVNSLPRQMIRMFSTFVLLGCKAASNHPQRASFIALTLITIIYVMLSAPRNGILMSGGSGIMSSGRTTFLLPPQHHLSNYLTSDKFRHLKGSMTALKKGGLADLFSDYKTNDGIHIASLTKKDKKQLSQVVSIVKSVPFEVLLPSEEELEAIHDNEVETNSQQLSDDELRGMLEERSWQDSIEVAFNSAESIIAARRFSEFIAAPSNRIRFVARGKEKENAVLALKGLGNWKRYGVVPLRVANEEQDENMSSVIYYTLKGGHFDGELKVSVEKKVDDEGDDNVVISISLLIPKGGRKMNTKLASKMLTMLADSIVTSTMTAARQTVSRKLQSTVYRGKAKSRAVEKRSTAFDNIQKMEEMAADRRRRWQRNNQGSGGSYRPTGFSRPEGSPSRAF